MNKNPILVIITAFITFLILQNSHAQLEKCTNDSIEENKIFKQSNITTGCLTLCNDEYEASWCMRETKFPEEFIAKPVSVKEMIYFITEIWAKNLLSNFATISIVNKSSSDALVTINSIPDSPMQLMKEIIKQTNGNFSFHVEFIFHPGDKFSINLTGISIKDLTNMFELLTYKQIETTENDIKFYENFNNLNLENIYGSLSAMGVKAQVTPIYSITSIGLIPPKVIKRVNPYYPDDALMKRIEGSVYVQVVIDENGTVLSASIEKSTNPIFNEPALRAARETKFSPSTTDLRMPVRVYWTLSFKFAISK